MATIPTLPEIMANVVIDEATQCWVWHGNNNGRYGIVRWYDSTRTANKAVFQLYYDVQLEDEDRVYRLPFCTTELCVSPFHCGVITQYNGERVFIRGILDKTKTFGRSRQMLPTQDGCHLGHGRDHVRWRVRPAQVPQHRRRKTWPEFVYSEKNTLPVMRLSLTCVKCQGSRSNITDPDDDWIKNSVEYLNSL